MVMNKELDKLLTDADAIKSTIKSENNRYQIIRDNIYNALTNSGLDSYKNDDFSVSKVEDSKYLNISKRNFLNALEQASIPKDKQDEIMHFAFTEIDRSGSIMIRKRSV